MNKLASINLLTYNGDEFIEDCLKSVLEQTYQNLEILVIDNASIDKTVDKIKNFKVRIIENKKNLGFAAGHNLGIRESRGEYVLCLNQDVILDKDFVKYAVEAMERDKKIGSVQGKLYKKDKILDTTGLLAYKNRRFVNRGQGEKDSSTAFGTSEEIFGVDGAVPLYRREALENTRINHEYFDEDFFMYKEDVDLAWRLRLYGWKAIYEPRASGYHPRGAGEKAVKNYINIARQRRKISQFAKFYSFRNQRLMQIKNELPALFFRDFHRIIIKEVAAWLYILIFERYGFKAILSLFKQARKSWQKRKIIMANRKVGAREMKKWFI